MTCLCELKEAKLEEQWKRYLYSIVRKELWYTHVDFYKMSREIVRLMRRYRLRDWRDYDRLRKLYLKENGRLYSWTLRRIKRGTQYDLRRAYYYVDRIWWRIKYWIRITWRRVKYVRGLEYKFRKLYRKYYPRMSKRILKVKYWIRYYMKFPKPRPRPAPVPRPPRKPAPRKPVKADYKVTFKFRKLIGKVTYKDVEKVYHKAGKKMIRDFMAKGYKIVKVTYTSDDKHIWLNFYVKKSGTPAIGLIVAGIARAIILILLAIGFVLVAYSVKRIADAKVIHEKRADDMYRWLKEKCEKGEIPKDKCLKLLPELAKEKKEEDFFGFGKLRKAAGLVLVGLLIFAAATAVRKK